MTQPRLDQSPPPRPASRPRKGPHAAIGLILLTLAAPAAAQQQFGSPDVEDRAASALAVLGLAAVPSETASMLSLNGGINGSGDTQFRSSQFGAGYTFPNTRIYVEGYLGWNSYDPTFVFSDGKETSEGQITWQSVAATAGLGYNFPLTPTVTFRPILNVSLGNITSETEQAGGPVGDVTSFLNSGLTVGGLGGALALEYTDIWNNGWEADATLRHNQLYLFPIGGDAEVVGDAHAFTTALWSRLRIPTPWSAFDKPIRSVSEFSLGHFSGDQGQVLDTSWLMQAGVGAELDLSETDVPWVSRARVMLRYTKGDQIQGLSLGFSADF